MVLYNFAFKMLVHFTQKKPMKVFVKPEVLVAPV